MIILRTFLNFNKKNINYRSFILDLDVFVIFVRAVASNHWDNGGLDLKIDLSFC